MPIEPSDFDFIRQLVRRHSAIVIDEGKEYLAEARLATVASDQGVGEIRDLVMALRGQTYGPLHREVVEAMTTNETLFFRDIHPFTALKDTVLPELMKKRANERTLNIWSAASSTGQEPYSIAMLIRESFPQLASWTIKILGTDLSTEVLDKARAAIYSQLEVNRGLPATMLVKYFTNQGINWHLDPETSRMVEFRQMNLDDTWSLMPRFDIIFLRNVLIYFDRDVKASILGRARDALQPDGYLFLGNAETTLHIDDSYERYALGEAVCYRPQSVKEAGHAVR